MMRMSFCLIFLVMSQPAWSQSARDQAADAMNGVPGISSILTNENMQETVVPFETANPAEATLSESEFEDRMFDIRTGDSDTSRAYGSTVDSALTRPDVDLGDDPLSLADQAFEHSEGLVGGLFTSEPTSCSQAFRAGQVSELRQCTRILMDQYGVCTDNRVASVDRTDLWSCEVEAAVVEKTCSQSIDWVCSGSTGAACLQQGYTVSPTPVWNAPGQEAQLNFSGSGAGVFNCRLSRDSFTISAEAWVQFQELYISTLRFNGIAQVRVNGVNVWTSGTSNRNNLGVGGVYGVNRCDSNGCWFVYLGNTRTYACWTLPDNQQSPNIDLLPYLPDAVLGPTTLVNNSPNLNIGPSRSVTVEILRASAGRPQVSVTLRSEAECCSAFSPQGGGEC